jgi:hypothetical protein
VGLAVAPAIVLKAELAETFYAVTVARRFPHPLVDELSRKGEAAFA